MNSTINEGIVHATVAIALSALAAMCLICAYQLVQASVSEVPDYAQPQQPAKILWIKVCAAAIFGFLAISLAAGALWVGMQHIRAPEAGALSNPAPAEHVGRTETSKPEKK
jgi:mannose/fructose/N-acetylgalactosamine-specific phosphotransferase system component IIC